MTKLEVFDRPMCCSTGICGPDIDPVLVRFAADLQWLAQEGIQVERYTLSQQPQAFAANTIVRSLLDREGNECLPLILVDGQVASQGRYVARDDLARFSGVGVAASIYTASVAELVAIGASIAANCEPCFKFHFQQAKKLGVSREDMMRAVTTAQSVKETPAKAITQLASRILEGDQAGLPVVRSCCG